MKICENFILLPKNSVDVSHMLMDAGRSKEESVQTIKSTGISHIRHANGRLFTDFVFQGLATLATKFSETITDIDGIIVVSQSFDQRIPSVSSRIQAKFNLNPNVFCIDVMDGCSGYIKALSLASMLEAKGYEKIMVIAGDINSTITNGSEIGAKILFGDGISVTILQADNNPIDTRLFNDGDLDQTIFCKIADNKMLMNGFEVFRFTRNVVPSLIYGFLNETSQTFESYDLIALHQASKLVVDTICRSCKFSNNFSDDFSCGKIGNIGAGSIGAWLSQIGNIEQKGDLKMLAVGFGSGLSWGLASLHLNLKHNEVIYV